MPLYVPRITKSPPIDCNGIKQNFLWGAGVGLDVTALKHDFPLVGDKEKKFLAWPVSVLIEIKKNIEK